MPARTKYYKKYKKGMKKAKNGKYYYPRKKQPTTNYRGRQSFAMKRQPLVETKKHEGVIKEFAINRTSARFIPPTSFQILNRGIQDNNVLGSSIFSKYYSMKLKFVFPRDEYSIQKNYRIQVIHGWMTAPYGLPEVSNNYIPQRGSVTTADLVTIQQDRLSPAWTHGSFSNDDLEFRNKEKKIYRVEGKQWIRPNRNNQIGFAQQFGRYAAETDHLIGGIPDVKVQLQWKPMRKINLTDSTNGGGSNTPFLYPNEAWIPFVCVYTPDFENLPVDSTTANLVQCHYNDCHWYSDS